MIVRQTLRCNLYLEKVPIDHLDKIKFNIPPIQKSNSRCIMTIQEIIPKSEKSLKPAAKVLDFTSIYIRQAVADLLDTLAEKQRTLDLEFPGQGAGVGLAANQIKYPYEPVSDIDDSPKPGCYPKDFPPPDIYVISILEARAAIEKCEPVEPLICINATFTPLSNEKSFEGEGCLSVTGFHGFKIPRYETIEVEAWNARGEKMRFEAKGFIARVHQHEQDHSLGMEYLNRLNFSEDELKTIIQWIDEHENKPVLESSQWVVEGKLRCVSESRDGKEALAIWASNALTKLLSENSSEDSSSTFIDETDESSQFRP